MILRTYSRRSRADVAVAASSSESEDEQLRFPFSQESYGGGVPTHGESYEQYGMEDLWLGSQPQEDGRGETATLMEAQECGEMMEHMDEVNFALDGLRPSQPVRVRRASLLSLLTVCAGAQQRRLLRAQGTMKRIIDAVMALNFDDSPSAVASAALFYILASDAQDDLLLESPACVQFLIKLLNPPTSDAVMDKAPSIGSRLMLIRPPEIKNGISRRLDSGATSINSKIQEILLHCNEIKPPENDDEIERPELSSKWIGLLTMEKACLSTVSFEDISGSTRKNGGDFKEKLRELGGLDAVINIAVSCYSNMEGCVKQEVPTTEELKGVLASENVILFLRCLKIMENATFLSKENQDHLLQVTLKLDKGSSLSCVELIIHAIKFFSGLLLHQRSFPGSQHGKLHANSIPESQSRDLCQETQSRILSNSSAGCPGVSECPPSKSSEAPSKRQRLSQSKQGYSMQGSEVTCGSGSFEMKESTAFATKTPTDSLVRGGSVNTNESRENLPKGSNQRKSMNTISSKMGNIGSSGGHLPNSSAPKTSSVFTKRNPNESEECSATSPDGHFDPFAFDEDDLGPSKWDSLTMPKKTNLTRKSTRTRQTTNGNKKLEDQNQCTDMDTIPGYSSSVKLAASSSLAIEDDHSFAFDEDEPGPSKWESLTMPKKTESRLTTNADKKSEDQSHQCTPMDKALGDGSNVKLAADSSLDIKDDHSNEETDVGLAPADEDYNLLEDCLLSAVKVLMNLTNNNLMGCQQIGSYGGLDMMTSLIVNHFPAFDSTSYQLQDEVSLLKDHGDSNHSTGKRLSDHELDFLVAILGLLVNLVEKDSNNRSRLVCTRIPADEMGRLESHKSPKEVIHLLCSIFLVNQRPERATENVEISQPCNDETALLQGAREAEMMIVEAYAALLLAFLSTESKKTRDSIANCLPSRNLRILVPVLERFVEFHLSLNMISPETHTAVSEVIESCRIP